MKRFLQLPFLITSAGISHAAIVNLAPLGTEAASSTAFGGTVDRGNDGDRNGVFGDGSVFHSGTTTPAGEWYEVDLGSENYLDRVMVFPRTDQSQLSLGNFNIEVFSSLGDSVYSGSFLGSSNTQDDPWGISALSGVLGQRVRLTKNDPGFFTISEFEIWGSNTPITNNITSMATISGGAGAFGTTLADATDGDLASNYNSVTGDRPIYHDGVASDQGFFRLDYDSLMVFDEVQLFNRIVNNAPTTTTAFRVSILDGMDNVVTSQVITPQGSDYDNIIDFAGTTGRAVLVEEEDQTQFLAFSEVRVFGAPVPEPSSALLSLLAAPFVFRRRR